MKMITDKKGGYRVKQDALRRLWPERLGNVLQVMACLGLALSAILLSLRTRASSYLSFHNWGYEGLFHGSLIVAQFAIYLPLLLIGRCLSGYGGPLPVVWWTATFYLLVQHVFYFFIDGHVGPA